MLSLDRLRRHSPSAFDGKTLATGSEDKTLRLRKLPAELIPPALEK